MPHLPDDDGYQPRLKVLRKRLNGVYREDLGFSGPTRRYVLMVALLVGLASVPTLAVLTAGRSEITGTDRPGAMDMPFLPPPASGPVRPFPPPSVAAPTDQGYGHRPRPGKSGTPSGPAASRHPSSPSSPTTPNADIPSPGRVFPPSPVQGRTSPRPPDRKPARVLPPTVPSAPPAGVVPSRPAVPARPARPKRVQPQRMARSAPGGIPTVPELPAVPAEDEVPKWSRSSPFPSVAGLPPVPGEPSRSSEDRSDRDRQHSDRDRPDRDRPDRDRPHRDRPHRDSYRPDDSSDGWSQDRPSRDQRSPDRDGGPDRPSKPSRNQHSAGDLPVVPDTSNRGRRATPGPRAVPDEPDRGSSDHDESPCPDHGSLPASPSMAAGRRTGPDTVGGQR